MSNSVRDDDVWAAVASERRALALVLAQFGEAEWDQESLCAGWRVRDVVAHLILATRASLRWILVNVIRARGNIARGAHETAIRLADETPTATLLALFRATADSRFTPLGTTAEDRLMDLLVHIQDIAIPLGIDCEMPVAAAETAVRRVWTMGAPFHARKRFADYRLIAEDSGWSAGDGTAVRGSTADLLLLLTGRTATLHRLGGPGAELLRAEVAGEAEPG
ncbi:maleylpyruvate isomerase family mycothiol-dependent enzyme [Nocardia sp. 2]|uniref:Maleylpyruvate isomerase family mycothiol-dependent enzyme n=1 Tax=Nocardia acididurans TaxID=2802282 RepID=A0ABS1M9Y0_9NOCA|nr:maleylpyruvate isomerase family mycothiol-dependent enzyme [Nocardia acididurans]MBL1077044.1 maleylpyruvate isomerase family mycothiol-dependent enzyme [Nocardia acididurans]